HAALNGPARWRRRGWERIGVETRRPVGSLPSSKPPTGPAPPRRSVCAPAAMSRHSIADQPGKGERTMSFHSWLQNLRSTLARGRGPRHPRRRRSLGAAPHRPSLEVLEDRLPPGDAALAGLLAGDLVPERVAGLNSAAPPGEARRLA